jgi:hypothetical protein
MYPSVLKQVFAARPRIAHPRISLPLCAMLPPAYSQLGQTCTAEASERAPNLATLPQAASSCTTRLAGQGRPNHARSHRLRGLVVEAVLVNRSQSPLKPVSDHSLSTGARTDIYRIRKLPQLSKKEACQPAAPLLQGDNPRRLYHAPGKPLLGICLMRPGTPGHGLVRPGSLAHARRDRLRLCSSDQKNSETLRTPPCDGGAHPSVRPGRTAAARPSVHDALGALGALPAVQRFETAGKGQNAPKRLRTEAMNVTSSRPPRLWMPGGVCSVPPDLTVTCSHHRLCTALLASARRASGWYVRPHPPRVHIQRAQPVEDAGHPR